MRATLHLVTADDCLLLRPLMQPVLDAELARHRDHGPALAGVDLAPALAFARTFARRATTHGHRAARRVRRPIPRSRRAGARLRLPEPARVRPGAATRRVGPHRSGRVDHGRGVARPAAGRRPLDRRGGAPLPRRVRSGDGRRRVVVVAPDRDARGGRAAPPATAVVPRRATAASCSTCPTHRVPIPTRRRRRGSSPSTTTCCCRTPTGLASCATTAAGSRGPPTPIQGTVLARRHDRRDVAHRARSRATGTATLVVDHVRLDRTSARRRSPPKVDASSASTSRMPRRTTSDSAWCILTTRSRRDRNRSAPPRPARRRARRAISRGRRRRLPTSLVSGNGSRPATRGTDRPRCMSPHRR